MALKPAKQYLFPKMQRIQTSLAKISQPCLSGVYLRKRLMRLLDHGRKKPAIWICGPAGAGKTTLAASYLKHTKLPFIWYQADERDADVAALFFYMGKAAEKIPPGRQKPLPLLTPEYLAGVKTFSRNYFESLYNRLKPPFVIVFDNCQDAPGESLFHEVICDAAAIIPEGITTIFISRNDPPPVFAGLRARQQMEIIDWNVLRLDHAETRGMVKSLGYTQISGEILLQLHRKTEGWAAGLILLMENLQQEKLSPAQFNGSTPEVIFNFFANEVFLKMDSETRDFLIRTAYFPAMTVQMASELTGQQRVKRILARLHKSYFFTDIKRAYPEPLYQYHALFREFLLAKASEEFSATNLSRLQQSAAKLLESSGQVNEAAELYHKSGNWNELSELIYTHAERLMAQGRSHSLRRWIGYIPENVRENNPWLLYWYGISCMPYNPAGSLPYFEKAFHSFGRKKNAGGMALSLSGAVDAIIHESNNYKLLNRWIKLFGLYHNRLTTSIPDKIKGTFISSIFFAMVMRQPQHVLFNRCKKRVSSLFENSPDNLLRTQIGWPLAIFYFWSGDFSNLRLMAGSFRRMLGSVETPPLVFVLLKLIDIMCCLTNVRYESLLESVTEGLEKSKNTGVHLWDMHLLGFGAAGALSMGDTKTAQKFFMQMKPLIVKGDSAMNTSFYHFVLAWGALLDKDLSLAKTHAEMAAMLAEELGAAFPLAMTHYLLSLVFYESGMPEQARYHLTKARRTGRSMKSTIIEFMCRLAKAYFLFEEGRNKGALKLLHEAMSLGKKNNYVNFFVWLPDIMAKLCAKALENGIETEYALELVRCRKLVPVGNSFEMGNWSWPVKIYTMGRFCLVKNGSQLKFTGKAPQKPLELLKALIACGGRGVSEAKLADLLWPDAPYDLALKSFSVTLTRLRKMLGIDDIIELSEKRLSLNPSLCWVDVWEFECAADCEGNVTKDSVLILERALALYQGPFLSGDMDKPWLAHFRERLRGKYLDCVITLGKYREQEGEYDRAVSCYLKGLDANNLSEELYRRIMVCYQRLGRNAEAVAVYNKCRNTISGALGIEVSDKTTAIYQNLKKSQK